MRVCVLGIGVTGKGGGKRDKARVKDARIFCEVPRYVIFMKKCAAIASAH